ncbi:serine/threonine protein phosphatase, partial [Streptomyces fradiae]
MTEHPTSHEGRQPLAARPQERTRPRQEAPGAADDAAVAAPPHGRPHPGAPVPAQHGPVDPADGAAGADGVNGTDGVDRAAGADGDAAGVPGAADAANAALGASHE